MKFATLTAAAALLSATTSFAAVIQSDNSVDFDADAFGLTLSFIDFDDGVDDDVRDGASYSPDVVFSSGVSDIFGGVDSSDVSDSSVEMGPADGFDGLLIMEFVADITAIAFNSFQFGPPETIEFFDDGSLVFSGVAGGTSFDGFVSSDAVFDTVILDGSFYSIGDLTYAFADVAPIPLPASALFLGLGLAGFGVASRRKAR